ncbi:MAG TPA: metal-dependent transcriptional regulator [Chloroflexi bacterium]|nr:metal-dependent transcriptional regulator [Chloroflexota bacterium]
MSESVEMYLLRIALLQNEDQPVPIPALAHELAISPVSANEMGRKLTDKGLVRYEPYKGVTLTLEGEAQARQILHRRRLWEVFLVEKLGLEADEAEDMACRFEHVTPERLAGQLAAYLDYPSVSPQNEPIPYQSDISTPQSLRSPRSLALLSVGEASQVVEVAADETTTAFLKRQGIETGSSVTVLAITGDGSLLLDVSGQRLSLAQAIAGDVKVI